MRAGVIYCSTIVSSTTCRASKPALDDNGGASLVRGVRSRASEEARNGEDRIDQVRVNEWWGIHSSDMKTTKVLGRCDAREDKVRRQWSAIDRSGRRDEG